MNDPINENFYGCKELSEILGILPVTLARHARSGRFPACQPYPNGPWFFPKDEIAAYLRKRMNTVASPFVKPMRARKAG